VHSYLKTGIAFCAIALWAMLASALPTKTSRTNAPPAEVAEDDFLPTFGSELTRVRGVIDDYSKRIKKNPKDATLYFRRGEAYSAIGEHIKARQDRKKAVELDPEFKARADEYEAITPTMLNTEIAIGHEFLKRGKYEFAEVKFRSAIEADPTKAVGLVGMGLLCNAQKQHAKALDYFKRAIELEPAFQAGYYQRANTYLMMGQPAKALPDLAKTLQISERAEAYYLRSLAYKALKQTDRAEEDMKKAVAMDADVVTKVEGSKPAVPR
jgi:tetratricopeptide (TPR) repeat protein